MRSNQKTTGKKKKVSGSDAREDRYLAELDRRHNKYTKGSYDPDQHSDDGDESAGSDQDTNHSESEDEMITTNPKKIKRQLKEMAEAPDHKRIKIDTVSLNAIRTFRYVAGGNPVYVAADRAGTGGKKSTATLGPGGVLDKKSDADRALLPHIDSIEAAYGTGFMAGHLLNACFGGSGTDGRNLTALTDSANSAHRGFDENVKRAGGALFKAYETIMGMGIDITTLTYGIKVVVSTDGWWSDDHTEWGYYVCDKLVCSAQVVQKPTLAALRTLIDARQGVGNRVRGHDDLEDQLLDEMQSVQDHVDLANQADEVPNII
ncbi:MAG TPA: hypothetical protein VHV49_02155 [Pseudonocardiaceae bacterium]|nr:hypothetical protein [Pseudonocardiaceae bacterium]